jgi:hypothetical protein
LENKTDKNALRATTTSYENGWLAGATTTTTTHSNKKKKKQQHAIPPRLIVYTVRAAFAEETEDAGRTIRYSADPP